MKSALLAFSLLLFGCTPPHSGLDTVAIRSAEILGIEDTPIILVDGQWEGEPHVEGGASRSRVGLVEEFEIRGEFIEPGREDCAVLLWHSTGGTGNRLWLVILKSAPGRPRTASAELVGDRVQVMHFCYFDGLLRLDLIAHGPGDAGCCPGQFERRAYRVVGEELVESTEIVGRASTKDLDGDVWRLERMRRGDEPGLALEVTIAFDRLGKVTGEAGCNSYGGDVENADGRNVRIEVGPTSARRCTGEALEIEEEFTRRLEAVERFAFMNGRLALLYVLEGEADAMYFAPPGW